VAPGNLWPQVAKKNNKWFPGKNSVPFMKKKLQGALQKIKKIAYKWTLWAHSSINHTCHSEKITNEMSKILYCSE